MSFCVGADDSLPENILYNAQGNWSIGSHIDLLIIVAHSDKPFIYRATDFETSKLPVPADVLVYTLDEWEKLQRSGRFGERLRTETIWLYERGDGG